MKRRESTRRADPRWRSSSAIISGTIGLAGILVMCVCTFILFHEPDQDGGSTSAMDWQDRTTDLVAEERIDSDSRRTPDVFAVRRIAVTGQVSEIRGRAVTESGQSISGMNVHLAAGNGRVVAAGFSRDDGGFVLTADHVDWREVVGTMTGKNKPSAVIVEGAGWFPVAVLITERMIADHVGVDLDLGDLVLQPAGTLRLAVTAADFSPLAPVHVDFLNEKAFPLSTLSAGTPIASLPEPIQNALTDVAHPPPYALVGMPHPFSKRDLDCCVPAGLLLLRAWNDQHPLVESDLITMRQGETTRTALELATSDSIMGVCVDRYERPLEGVPVHCWPVSQEGPDDYVRLEELRLRGEKGTSICPTFVVKTDRDGAFRLAPLLAGLRYEIWCNSPGFEIIDVSAETPLEGFWVPVGTRKLKFILKRTPVLRLTLYGDAGEALGPGPGNALIEVEVGDHGWQGSFALQKPESILPLPLKGPIPENAAAVIKVGVQWGQRGMGSTELELHWNAESADASVSVNQANYYDLGTVPFDVAETLIQWDWNERKTISSFSNFGDELTLPCWSSFFSGPSVLLGRDPASGSSWILSDRMELDWIVLWESEYRQAVIVDVDAQNGAPHISKRINLLTTGKILSRLEEDMGLESDPLIVGSIEAWYPEICGKTRIGQWGFSLDPTPGAEPVIWPSHPYQYKPAPNPSATHWRPAGLTYTISCSSTIVSDGEIERAAKLIEQTFTLDDEIVISVIDH